MINGALRALDALRSLDAGCDRDEWLRISMSAKAAGVDEQDWLDWCATGVNYGGERECRAVWRSITQDGGITDATLFHLARAAGWKVASCARRRDLQPAHAPLPEPRQRSARTALAPGWLDYWNRLTPPHGACLDYLRARKCAIPPPDGDLRCDSQARHPDGYAGPCLVALVRDYETLAPISMHRTWIKADGNKPDVCKPRRLLAGHRKSGGAIFLWPAEAVGLALGVAEGIETSLTLARYYRPVWSLIDAGNLKQFTVLPGIEAITICADNDKAGLAAANKCAQRWADSGREARIVLAPAETGTDLNDFLQGVRHA